MKTNLLQKNIPKGWGNYTLESLVDIYNGKTPLRSRNEFWDNGVIPWFTIEDLRRQGREISNTSQKITNEAVKKTGIKILPKNTVLICCTASVGECAFSTIELATNQQFNGLVVKNSKILNEKFLYYIISSFDSHIRSLAGTTTFGFVSVGKLGSVKVLIPTIFDQKKIAEILSSVDEEIKKVDDLISKTEELKKGLMTELFTKGIGHKKFKKTKIGVIPEDWGVVNLSEIGSNTIGLTYSPKDVVSDGGVLVFRSSNIFGNRIKYGDNVYVKKEIPNHLITKRGDILLCTRNGSRNLIGKNAYIDTESEGNSFGAFMSVYRTQYSKFVFQFFQSKFFKDQVNQYLGATINQITTKSLNSFLLPLPSMEEQDKITRILISFDEKLETNKKLKEKLIHLKKGLMSDLLSGKVRVIK